MADIVAVGLTISYRNTDGTAVSQLWVITPESARELAERMGPPHAEQVIPADALAEMADIHASLPLMTNGGPSDG